ncbi:MAG TPA: hypothetical protein VEP50_05725 [bacterium]|nr:hypothetical protein [bacterium]
MIVALAGLLTGCQGRPPASHPAAQPPAGAVPAGPKVAVVDFARALRAHPRWPDVDALDHRIAQLEGQLAVPTAQQFQVPQVNLQPQIQAAAQQELQQIRPQYQQQFDQTATALRDASRKELDAFVAQVRAAEQAQFNEKQQALQAQITKAVQDKQQALDTDNEQFQQQTLQQYRLPLLNLQLKRESLAPGDRQQQQRLDQQIQAMTKERDDKVVAHEKANQQALMDFQQQQNQAYTQQLADLETQLNADAQQQVAAKEKEINDRLHAALVAKQAELGAEMTTRLKAELSARQQALVQDARAQIEHAQQQAVSGTQAQVLALRAQLQEAQGERARLLAEIIADLRVETAELAQQKGYDIVLTQALATADVTDITSDLIARIKR